MVEAEGETRDQGAGAVMGEEAEAALLVREAEQVEPASDLEAVEAAEAGTLWAAAATFLGTFAVVGSRTVAAVATLAAVGTVVVASGRPAVVAARASAFPDLEDPDPSSG